MDDVNIVHAAAPTVPIFKGSAGQEIYKALLKYQHLEEALLCAETKKAISYKKLLEKTCALAQAFIQYGFSANTVISICSENCLEYFYLLIASWYLGIVVAPINYQYTKDELCHVISLSKPVLIFCSTKTLKQLQEIKATLDYVKKIVVIDSETDIEGIECFNSFTSNNTRNSSDYSKFQPVELDGNEQVAVIFCSSGTTGLAKGVMVTHNNIISRFAQIKEPDFNTVGTPTSTVLTLAPLFHCFGAFFGIDPLLFGGRIVVMKKFEPMCFLKCIEEFKIKAMRLTPPTLLFLSKSSLCSQYDLSSLETISFGGAPLSKEVLDAIKSRLGEHVLLLQGYGLTEATIAITTNPKSKSKFGSIGTLLARMVAKVVDVQSNKSLEAHKPGELWVKGPLVTKGYIGNPKATQDTFVSDGWLKTGDVVYYDEEGYFYVIDRLKEIIKYKGFQVAPAELEALLLQHPKISDAGVIGVPDEEAGELPAAFVTKKMGEQLDEQDVLDFVASHISPQKQLRGGVYFVDTIPKSPSGKILRRKLCELYKQKVLKV